MAIKFELTEKEKRLEALVRALPDNYYSVCPIPDEYEGMIEHIIKVAHRYGWVDEFIRICEANEGKELSEVMKIMFSPDRRTCVTIYDENTGEILGYGQVGNFPEGFPRGKIELDKNNNE